MNLYILLIILVFNMFILFFANKYKNKLNIGTIFLYTQTTLVVSTILCIAQFSQIISQHNELISFTKCTFYSSVFVIAYFVYLLAVAINNISFKIEKYITLAVPTLIAISLLYTNSFSNFMISKAGINSLLFELFIVYHFILGSIGLLQVFISSSKQRSVISSAVSIFFSLVFISGVLIQHATSNRVLNNKTQIFTLILFSLITASVLKIVKEYKYEMLSKKGLIDSILSLNAGMITYNIFDKILHTNDNFQTVLDTLHIDHNIKKSNDSFTTLLKKFNNNGNTKKIEKDIEKAKKTGKLVLTLLTFKIQEEIIYYKVKIYPLYKNNVYTGCMLLFNNITTNYIITQDNIKLDTQVFTQSKIDTISEMIGCIVHDINTPLSTIKTGTSLLLEKYKNDEFKLELLDQIEKDSKQISSTSVKVRNQIRTLGSNTISDFSITDLIKNLQVTFIPELHKHNSVIIFDDINEEIKLTGNYSKLFQSVYNIISNAIEAYPASVSTEKNKIIVSTESNKKDLYIKIKDFAGGINDTILPQIFNDIITTEDGTAIGLYLAYSIITSHFNGDVFIDVEKGIGTTVTISIPLNEGGN